MAPEAGTRPAPLAHHFGSYAQQRESATLGMWVFIAQEVMFFSGVFLAYTLYRWREPALFALGSNQLDLALGIVNTVVLIASSLTMVLAVRSAQLSRSRDLVAWLLATLALGTVFLAVKGVEYHQKWAHHLLPGTSAFHLEGAADQAKAQVFFFLYFVMTGLHALHMVVGLGLLASLVPKGARGRFSADNHNWVEGVGLYWHFVDIVWIFLFPLLYLIGRHH